MFHHFSFQVENPNELKRIINNNVGQSKLSFIV